MSEERVRELEEALLPFAMYAVQMEKAWTQLDDSCFYGVKRGHQIRYGDFRRAARVMKGKST